VDPARTIPDLGPAGDDRTRTVQSLIVKTVESCALSRIGDHLRVSDLCRAAKVSGRTLESAFKEIMELTPVACPVRLRLHQVRRALLAATRGSTRVSAVALDWGFWHFGEFSRAYEDSSVSSRRRHFDEGRPKHTAICETHDLSRTSLMNAADIGRRSVGRRGLTSHGARSRSFLSRCGIPTSPRSMSEQ
jgi:AraC-like DNA-binding protein